MSSFLDDGVPISDSGLTDTASVLSNIMTSAFLDEVQSSRRRRLDGEQQDNASTHLASALTKISLSGLQDAVAGEDPKSIVTREFQLESKRSSPENVRDAGNTNRRGPIYCRGPASCSAAFNIGESSLGEESNCTESIDSQLLHSGEIHIRKRRFSQKLPHFQ